MINKVVGDSIVFEVNLTDAGGTAVTDAVGSLTIVDGGGSTVLATHAPHTSAGTYQRNQSTVGWGKGPIVEYWKFMNSAGTTSKIVSSGFRIVGTETIQPYVSKDELKSYYENIEDYFDGHEEAVVEDAFQEINTKLEAMGYKMPIKVKSTGFHDQPLKDWNAYNALQRIISRRQNGYNREDEKPWFTYFGDRAGSIYTNFQNKVYNLDREVSVAEAGVGQGTKTVGTSPGQLETNWRGGVGTGFTDPTFERDWQVLITGTGTSGTINECEFKWSRDGGLSFATSFTTNFDWQHLEDGVFVRFHRGTSTSATSLFEVADKWTWKTYPRNQAVAGKRAARSY
jgi:hypothetical protein